MRTRPKTLRGAAPQDISHQVHKTTALSCNNLAHGGFRGKLSLHVALKVKAKSHGAKHHEVRTLCVGAIRYSTELRLSDISFGV